MAGTVWTVVVMVTLALMWEGEGVAPVRTDLRRTVDASLTRDKYLDSYSNTVVARRRYRRGLMFPGTKWCGLGNKAKNDSDLGTDVKLDRCCRAHDHCNRSIPANSTKYGLENRAPYTRSHCDCDDTFRQCLTAVRSFSSSLVGSIFFGVSASGCFRLDYPAACVDRDSVTERCLQYTFNTSSSQIWQFFDTEPWTAASRETPPSTTPTPTTSVRRVVNAASTLRHRVDVWLFVVACVGLFNIVLRRLCVLISIDGT